MGRSERTPCRRFVGILVAVAAAACSGIDGGLLIDPGAPAPNSTDAGDDRDGGAGGTGPAAGAGATGGMGGASGTGSGMGAAGGMGGSAGSAGSRECIPNPNEQDEVCPEICPETCNNLDDDCDLRIDEEEAAADCDFPNTESTCRRGACLVIACENGYRDCDTDGSNGCETPEDDVDHCGVCGNVCKLTNAIEACVDGGCVAIGCDDGYGDCDDDGLDCEASTKTLAHCGDCGKPCGGLDNAVSTCDNGVCEPASCVGNFGDCNAVPDDGCEIELVTLAHCGGCDVPCDLGGSADDCSGGVCLSAGCELGFADCDMDPSNACDSLDSVADCGTCGARCDDALPHVTSGTCDSMSCNLVCDDGYGNCSGGSADGCETALDSLQNCGGCGDPCMLANAVGNCSTRSCQIGQCNDGWGDCANGATDGCEQRLDTLVHCGGCNVPCAKFSCAGGVCTDVACTDPSADCDGDGLDCEIDTDTDLGHCGACNAPCAFMTGTPHATLECDTGVCRAVCDPDYDDCDGNYRNGCESLATLQNCGSCGATCAIAHATPTCATGSCRVASCDVDWNDCDADGQSCETDLTKTSNCGTCFNQCDLANAVEACTGSPGARICTISVCDAAYYRDCDMMHATGCEIDTRSNALHCSTCGNNCTTHPNVSTATCAASSCNYTCANGFGNCTGALGCETAVNTKQNCGACSFDCDVQLANTSATTCGAGPACQIVTCDPGYANCDMSHATGCETNIFTVTNCGGCASTGSNQACTGLSNVMASSCGAGTCVINTCNAGYANCDANVQNGCESQLAVDTQDCGTCGNDCEAKLNVAAAHCTGGACVVDTCDAPYADCGGAPDCETRIDTTTNCGSCGANCSVLLPNTTATQCTGGTTCNVVSCAAGHGDCTAGAGCETDIFTVTDCGGCSNRGMNEPCTALPHAAASSCGAGACVIDACDTNWEDCDGVVANGCELDQTTQTCCDPLMDADADGVDDCADECPNDAVTAVAGDCGCPSAPVVGGTLCFDGLCEANTQCDGFGRCGNPTACAPTGTCTFSTYATSTSSGYWTCTNAVLQATAATNCAAAVGGHLVRIDDVVENAFVDSRIASDSWMGGDDVAVEGAWRWSDDGDQFWSGAAGGTALLYAHWSGGEPNNSGDQDCLQMYAATGFWDDLGCTQGNRAYVCELPADQCPSETKLLPGVCGCAEADVDSDGDGFENCIETCDTDPLKQDPGACGCDNPETNSDGDGSPDCVDGCDYNANYTGACQAKRKKITIDGNQVPDLVSFAASNYTHELYTYANAVVLDCGGTHTYDSSTNAFTGTWCGVFPQTSLSVTQTTAGGPTVDILRFASLSIAAGTTLRLTGGTEPVILAVEGNATIAGVIDAGSNSTSVGAGANYACTPAPSSGAGGKGGGNCTGESGGGGGGGFGTAGGQGGQGDNSTGVRGAAGQTRGGSALSPLLGGCPGGEGGGGANAGFAGNGGGGVQLSVRGNLTVSGTIRSNGESGVSPVGCNEGGGGGGGSGGGVLIEAMGTLTTTGATITANGGSGGTGEDGTDGNGGGGSGGAGSTSSGSAGSNGSDHGTEGGGGGGGGYGRVGTQQTPNGVPPTGFPLLVRVTDAGIAFSAALDGLDIYFEDDLGAPLPFERVSYASGTLVAWVKMDLTGVNQDFYVYYGDGDRAEKSTPGTVWSSGYDAAWHMESVGPTLPDSTSNNHVLNREAAQSGTWPANAVGVIGGAASFDGSTCCTSGDYLYAAPFSSIDGGSFTVSAWTKRDTTSGWDYILAQGTSGTTRQAFHWGYRSDNGFRFAFWGDDLNTSGTWTNTTTFEHWVGTFNASGFLGKLYRNGVEVGSRTFGGVLNTTGNFEIGRQSFGFADYWDGIVDEVRVSSVVRSASWVLTEYNNQRSGSTFLSLGTEESL